MDVTELSERDIQGILGSIPADIRRTEYQYPKTIAGLAPSLYEIVELNVPHSNLKKRFRGVLKQLKYEDILLHDLLVVISYVHLCGTPVSFDMLMAFFRGEDINYEGIQLLILQLAGFITEYDGEFNDFRQDYFTPRSTLVADAVLDQVDEGDFQCVLTTFHKQVSPVRICRYDIFKRRAYDKNIVSKAFSKWEEGKRFYEEMYERDHSPYLLQQGALYLAHKKRYVEAFTWIDKALHQSRFKNPTIQNSHAIILFRANIDKVGIDTSVRPYLDQSMDILKDCYYFDRRKRYHATTFADHAIQYWNAYADPKAEQYLREAQGWLQNEMRIAPWHKNLKYLHRRVSDILARRLGRDIKYNNSKQW